MLFSSFHLWDFVLLAVVTLQATAHAYIPSAQWKAFVYLLPFPFTAAALALGLPIDSTNIWALLLLVAYSHGVRLQHINFRIPIQLAIASTLIGCALLGLALAPTLKYLQHRLRLIISEKPPNKASRTTKAAPKTGSGFGVR